jgi:hypothetical protein
MNTLKQPRARSRASLAVVGVLALAASLLIGPAPAAAEGPLPGMCSGRTDSDLVVVAIANGGATHPKYVLSVVTDPVGSPTGTLVLGQGSERLEVTQWCRVWLHVPGTSGGGSCEDAEVRDDATTAHAVGVGALRSGQIVTVRTDVRRTDEGIFFRVRYRLPEEHHAETAMTEHDDGCDGGWQRIPVEGWSPLRQLHVGPAD